ncbi:MAG: hypothetical protein LBM94_06230 [Propionibacteriaceae bacterium]|nr:hypothetical protein [Propionibacteriaceae bacterium]
MNIDEAIAFALTGEVLTPPMNVSAQSAAEFVAWLADVGWDMSRLRAQRAQTTSAGKAWPYPVAAAERSQVGAAQWFAILRGVVAASGVNELSGPINSSAPPTAADLRLLAEVPPHHVHGV